MQFLHGACGGKSLIHLMKGDRIRKHRTEQCHELAHDTENLADAKFWTEPKAGKENP